MIRRVLCTHILVSVARFNDLDCAHYYCSDSMLNYLPLRFDLLLAFGFAF